MKRTVLRLALLAAALVFPAGVGAAQSTDPHDFPDPDLFGLLDLFELEYASDPQISPDGTQVAYVRMSMDIMKDRRQSSLWILNSDGSEHRPLVSGTKGVSSPRWSPDGKRLLYVASTDESNQIHLLWLDSGITAELTNLQRSPSGITWSPDGEHIAFTMTVAETSEPIASLPTPPKGADWATPPTVIQHLNYRSDGAGYLEVTSTHVFTIPDEGGTPRQLTRGHANYQGTPSFTPDGKGLLISGRRKKEWEYDPLNSEVFHIKFSDRSITPLTNRSGPDHSPVVSPDGKLVAFVGFDDKLQGYRVSLLSVMNIDGSGKRVLTNDLDRSVQSPRWDAKGESIFFSYSDRGNSKIARITLDGKITTLAHDLGGTSLGRPYSSGSFSVARNGKIAFTHTNPSRPADIAIKNENRSTPDVITSLCADVLAHRSLAPVEEIWVDSSHDQKPVQGWVALPPDYEEGKRYPLILEIHGGPFANYGDRFSAEIQLYAASGYVVLYMNPRGSTSYGEEFGNLIHHNYPGEDYDDLMTGVDALIDRKLVDPAQLFVTGGSGGGVLTAWIVGKTNRFSAAVVAKPVINWTSFALTADMYPFFYKYWFPGFPWDHQDQYWRRSPLSLVGNVTTPTMLLTGEQDHRTPIAESEQYYQALKLRKVDSAFVRIPGASHGIARRPSQLMAKVAYILGWFERYRTHPKRP